MSALARSGIEVMVGVPNDRLEAMSDYYSGRRWVKGSVTRYLLEGVDVRYVAVGNMHLLSSYNGSFLNTAFHALENIQSALNEAGVGCTIKATVPFNIDVYRTPDYNPVPSAGRFRSDISGLMAQIVQFLDKNGAPFTVNIYPFLSLFANPNFNFNFAFFDGTNAVIDTDNLKYTNMFDACFDTLVSALKVVGFGDMPIIVGEVGWPTDADINARVAYAERFYTGLLRRLAANHGTPLRPNTHIEVYLFSLIDDNEVDIAQGDFNRHWGIFRHDGQRKFPLDISDQGQNKLLVGAKRCGLLPQIWHIYFDWLFDLSGALWWVIGFVWS